MKKGTLRIETRPTIPPIPIGLWAGTFEMPWEFRRKK
jgi:hypothetical protein